MTGFFFSPGITQQSHSLQYYTFINRLPNAPSAAMASKYGQAIDILVNAGTWLKLDAFWAIAADTSANGYLNFISSNNTLTPSGSITFSSQLGFQGDGSTGLLNTGFVPSSAGGNYTQNSSSYGFSLINNRTAWARGTANGFAGMGANTANTTDDFLVPLFSDGKTYGTCNSGLTTINVVNSSGTAKGTWIITRTSSTNVAIYHNGSSVVSSGVVNSSSPATNQFVIGARYLSSSSALTDWSADICACAFIGGGLTAGDIAALNQAMSIFSSPNFYGQVLEAANWGFNSLTFYDDFSSLSNVDTNDTTASGFKWYLHNAWPNASLLSYRAIASADPSGIILNSAGQGMQLSKGSHFNLTTACTDGAGGYHGQVFSGGGYFECSMNYNVAQAQSGFAIWPAFWSLGLNHLQNSNISNYQELDFYEAIPSGTGTISEIFGLHDWNITSPPSNTLSGNGNSSATIGGPGALPGAPTLTQFHTYSSLWIPSKLNGGTGVIKRFFDGMPIASTTQNYSVLAAPSPAFIPSSTVGAFSGIDSDSIFLILSAGPGTSMPANVNGVLVLQKSPTNYQV